MHSFCTTAGETHSEAIEMEAGLVTADKEDYHPQRMCPTLTRHRSVQLTRQQKAWRSALLGSIADDHKAEEHVLNFETALLSSNGTRVLIMVKVMAFWRHVTCC